MKCLLSWKQSVISILQKTSPPYGKSMEGRAELTTLVRSQFVAIYYNILSLSKGTVKTLIFMNIFFTVFCYGLCVCVFKILWFTLFLRRYVFIKFARYLQNFTEFEMRKVFFFRD